MCAASIDYYGDYFKHMLGCLFPNGKLIGFRFFDTEDETPGLINTCVIKKVDGLRNVFYYGSNSNGSKNELHFYRSVEDETYNSTLVITDTGSTDRVSDPSVRKYFTITSDNVIVCLYLQRQPDGTRNLYSKRSTDLGATFGSSVLVESGIAALRINNVNIECNENDDTLYVVHDCYNGWAEFKKFKMYKSTDKGQSWSSVVTPTNTAVCGKWVATAVSGDRLYVTNTRGTGVVYEWVTELMYTDNHGASWTTKTIFSETNWNEDYKTALFAYGNVVAAIIIAHTAWPDCWCMKQIYRSIDAGNNWNVKGLLYDEYKAIHHVDGWTDYPDFEEYDPTGIYISNSHDGPVFIYSTCWTVKSGTDHLALLISLDAGYSWIVIETPFSSIPSDTFTGEEFVEYTIVGYDTSEVIVHVEDKQTLSWRMGIAGEPVNWEGKYTENSSEVAGAVFNLGFNSELE